MDHIRELQGRLFIIAIAFVGISALAYPFFDRIVAVILAPLGSDHELVYLTPGGAFSFIIKVCLYVGIIGVLPLVIYHLYRFVMPVVGRVKLRTVLLYTTASFLLAVAGITFAYFVSLPAALYFLTGFNLYHIDPMITIDSYFSFVMTYLMAGALLFQIPLIMLIINSASPLKPRKLMRYQRHIIAGSFIIAALISPTPDALNQAILASPMIGMYQVGIVAVWSNSRSKRRGESSSPPKGMPRASADMMSRLELPSEQLLAVSSERTGVPDKESVRLLASTAGRRPSVRVRSVDGMTRAPHSVRPPHRHAQSQLVPPSRVLPRSPERTVSRSIDGIIA